VSSAISANTPDDVAGTTASTLAAIGVRIREVRQTRNMTLQALADMTKLSVSMLSLVERGKASPSIGSLIVVASALGITMSDLMVSEPSSEDELVVRVGQQRGVETAQHVIRKLIREDRTRGVSIAINEYEPGTGNADIALSHSGFEYGYVLEGTLTVEVEGTPHVLKPGDLISYHSRRAHKIWNFGRRKVRALWFNLDKA
jgi:transcriptional regulator with XRE-family HTH domain